MRVGACQGFALHSVELDLLANVTRYEVVRWSPTFFLIGTAIEDIALCQLLTFPLHTFVSIVCGCDW